MAVPWKAVALLIAVATFEATSTDPPTDVITANVTSNSVFVKFTKQVEAFSCEVKAQAKFLSTDVHAVNSTSTEVLVSGLNSNIRYQMSVRCFADNGTATAYSIPTEVRTYPNGSNVVVSRLFPNIFTVFLDSIPGARQWILVVENLNTTTTRTYVLNSPYKIFRDANADTTYRIRARISRINSDDLPENKSFFGDPLLVMTAKLSVFGRVILISQTYQNALSNQSSSSYKDTSRFWEAALLSEYVKTQPMVSRVQILEFESDISETIAHHEIFLSGSTLPDLASLILNNVSLYDALKITEDVNSGSQYWVVETGIQEGELELGFDTDGNCGGHDQRNFSLNHYDGWTQFIDFSAKEAASISDELTVIEFEENNLKTGHVSTELQSNSLYTIDQSYLFKTCQASNRTSFLYSRRYGSVDTPPQYNGTIVYSTGPLPNETNGIKYRVSEDLTEITIQLYPVHRAQGYNFSIEGIQTVQLVDLDSSKSIEATLTGYGPSQRYCIMMTVTINHEDWSQQTSEPSCFPFYSGSPNATNCRIMNVTENNFSVIFREVEFSVSYIIEISSSSYARNYTTSGSSYIFTGGMIPRDTYNVRVATQNPFGIGAFSETKSTNFWRFSDVSNSSMKLAWDNETVDLYYDVSILQVNRSIRLYTNEVYIDELEAGTLYDIVVTVVTSDGSALHLFTDLQITVPASPSNLTFESNSEVSIAFTWEKVIGAEFYIVMSEGSGLNFNTSLTSANLTNLAPNKGYSFRVIAGNSAGTSLGIVRRFFTEFQMPVNINTPNVTSDGFDLKWDGGTDGVKFEISISPAIETINTIVSGTFAKISGLLPSTSYSVTLKAVYDEGSAVSETFYVVTAPKSPTNMTLVSRTSDSLKISWAAVANVSSYYVQSDGGYATTVSTNSVHISSLSVGSVYNVSVESIGLDGKRSDRITNLYQTLPTSPHLTVTNTSQTSLSFTWSHPQGAEEFRIILISQSTGSVVKDEITVSNAIRFSNLTAGTEYNITASSIIGGDHSVPPYTGLAVTLCYPPGGIVVTSVTHNSVDMQWNATQGARSYGVEIESAERKRRSVEEEPKVTITSTEAKVENLAPGSRYYIRIAAVNSAGRSESEPVLVGTGASNPSELRALNVTTTSVVIEWEEQAGATNYKLQRSDEGDPLLVGLTGITKVKSLIPGTSYQFSLATLSQTQPGFRVFENTFLNPTVTVITVPLAPTDLNVSETSVENAVLVEWSESMGASLYFVRLKANATDTTLNTTGLNITVHVTSDQRFTFTVVAMNGQKKRSNESNPVYYQLDYTTDERSEVPFPWWIFLIIAEVIAAIITILLVLWFKRRRQSEDQQGNYDVLNPNRRENEGEVATNYVNMSFIKERNGNDEEERTSENNNDDREQSNSQANENGGPDSSQDGLQAVIPDDGGRMAESDNSEQFDNKSNAEHSAGVSSEATVCNSSMDTAGTENGPLNTTASQGLDEGTSDDNEEDIPIYATVNKKGKKASDAVGLTQTDNTTEDVSE